MALFTRTRLCVCILIAVLHTFTGTRREVVGRVLFLYFFPYLESVDTKVPVDMGAMKRGDAGVSIIFNVADNYRLPEPGSHCFKIFDQVGDEPLSQETYKFCLSKAAVAKHKTATELSSRTAWCFHLPSSCRDE